MVEEISLIVLIEVQAGKSKEQINAYKELAPIVLAEAGCLQYELKRVKNTDTEFVLMEKWASEKALMAHEEAPHMIAADAKNPLFRAKPATVMLLSNI